MYIVIFVTFVLVPDNVMHPLSMLQCSFAQKQWYWQESPNVGYGHAFSQFFPTKPGLQATMHYSRYLQRVLLLKPGN